jgi:hypothetical protein
LSGLYAVDPSPPLSATPHHKMAPRSATDRASNICPAQLRIPLLPSKLRPLTQRPRFDIFSNLPKFDIFFPQACCDILPVVAQQFLSIFIFSSLFLCTPTSSLCHPSTSSGFSTQRGPEAATWKRTRATGRRVTHFPMEPSSLRCVLRKSTINDHRKPAPLSINRSLTKSLVTCAKASYSVVVEKKKIKERSGHASPVRHSASVTSTTSISSIQL